MEQIFYACAYDPETMTRYVYDAGEFQENCYSFSEAVSALQYVLRQKPYHIIWGGNYIYDDYFFEEFSNSKEDLLALSVYMSYSKSELDTLRFSKKSNYDKKKKIGHLNNRWKDIVISDENIRKNNSAIYKGYLINHTKKLAINLRKYYKQSVGDSTIIGSKDLFVIDAIPILTETGGGFTSALFAGITGDSTYKHRKKWCGDLLEIVNKIPRGYTVINFRFANIVDRYRYCCTKYGLDRDNYILNRNKKRLVGTKLTVFGGNDTKSYLKFNLLENHIEFVPIKNSSGTRYSGIRKIDW